MEVAFSFTNLFFGDLFSCKLETGKEVLELLLAADEMQLEELIKPVQMYLLQEWEPWIRSNFILLHRVSSANSAFEKLFIDVFPGNEVGREGRLERDNRLLRIVSPILLQASSKGLCFRLHSMVDIRV
ncbi:3854_t:CDS:2 [Paraglomus brasilianum]|uniref:3854_t:CDS:1 n=1 Tax=Paraglomus brasilianum TaxID=144538 RepID=A0A9N9DP16_9GLOM|nr:3854_t:CDS:2 [Paraglomus brasilianum]